MTDWWKCRRWRLPKDPKLMRYIYVLPYLKNTKVNLYFIGWWIWFDNLKIHSVKKYKVKNEGMEKQKKEFINLCVLYWCTMSAKVGKSTLELIRCKSRVLHVRHHALLCFILTCARFFIGPLSLIPKKMDIFPICIMYYSRS